MPGLIIFNVTHTDFQTDDLNIRLLLHVGYNLVTWLFSKSSILLVTVPIPKLFPPGCKVVTYLLQLPFTTLLLGYDYLVTRMLHGCNKVGISIWGAVVGGRFASPITWVDGGV